MRHVSKSVLSVTLSVLLAFFQPVIALAVEPDSEGAEKSEAAATDAQSPAGEETSTPAGGEAVGKSPESSTGEENDSDEAADVVEVEEDLVLLSSSDSGVYLAEEADLVALAAMNSHVRALGDDAFYYPSATRYFRQYPSKTKHGFYSAEPSTASYSTTNLFFFNLDTYEKTLIHSFSNGNEFYMDEDAFYYLSSNSIRKYDFSSDTDSAYASLTLHGRSIQAFGVDKQGRIFTAETPASGEAPSEVNLYNLSGACVSSAEKQTEYPISAFDGFDDYGHFFYEAGYNWVYWGVNHLGTSVGMGSVSNDVIDMTPTGNSATVGMVMYDLACLEFVCQSSYYQHQQGAQIFDGRYLVTTSITYGRVQIFDMKEMKLIARLGRQLGANSGQSNDLSSVGVNAAYSKSRGTLLIQDSQGEIQEMDIQTGEVYKKYQPSHDIFNMMMVGDDLVVVELDGYAPGYLEEMDFSVPETVELYGSSNMKVGESQQLDCNMAVVDWAASGDAATISKDGVISAWKPGVVNVTATVIDGRAANMAISVDAAEAVSHTPMALQGGGVVLPANAHAHAYSWYSAYPGHSFNYQNQDGTMMRVEYVGDAGVVVESYGKDNALRSSQAIEMELPVFGGFYAGKDYNFLVFGQRNPSESNDVEVMRVVKYSKSWERLGSISFSGINTLNPFDAGSLDMTEAGDLLYVHTCHTMYKSSDGYNHQANMTFAINESSMTEFSSYTDVMNLTYGYVSHSFNQFIASDGSDVYRVDHGDANPRGIAVTRTPVNAKVTNVSACGTIMKFGSSAYNYNFTGASIGGIALSANNVLVAGNSVDQQAENMNPIYDPRNIFVSMVSKDFTNTDMVWLTSHDGSDGATVGVPYIVKVNDEHMLVMWEEAFKVDGYDCYKTCIAAIDGSGKVGLRAELNGVSLSDCEPILTSEGLVTWYVTDGASMKRYWVDPFNPQNLKGDVNLNGSLNIVDAQICYDIAIGGKYDNSSSTDLRARAEVTGDGMVCANDARAIQYAALQGWK